MASKIDIPIIVPPIMAITLNIEIKNSGAAIRTAV
jgi:hypothetical protein